MLRSRRNRPGVCRHGTCLHANFKNSFTLEIIVDMFIFDVKVEVSKSFYVYLNVMIHFVNLCDTLLYWIRSRQAGRYRLPCHPSCRRPALGLEITRSPGTPGSGDSDSIGLERCGNITGDITLMILRIFRNLKISEIRGILVNNMLLLVNHP